MSNCNGSHAPTTDVDAVRIISRSPYWRATGICPVCERRVKVSRPTREQPFMIFGAHRASAARDQSWRPLTVRDAR